jgi:hypothetical protein
MHVEIKIYKNITFNLSALYRGHMEANIYSYYIQSCLVFVVYFHVEAFVD